MLELHILLIFIIIAALIAVEQKDLFSAVVAMGAAGLGLCMAFIVLKAPDVAITQLVVETLALIILIRATLRTDLPFAISGRWFLNTVITLAFIISFLLVAKICFRELPPFGHPLMRVAQAYLAQGLAQTGAANMVSAIVLDYRALDTLCEGTVLFTAIMGVLAVTRRIGKRKETMPERGTDD